MSTQTGIVANDGLRAFFGRCRDGRMRMFKVVIEREELALDVHYEANGTWEEDWDRTVLAAVETTTTSTLLQRTETCRKDRWTAAFWPEHNVSRTIYHTLIVV